MIRNIFPNRDLVTPYLRQEILGPVRGRLHVDLLAWWTYYLVTLGVN